MKRWIAAGIGLLVLLALGSWRLLPGHPGRASLHPSMPATAAASRPIDPAPGMATSPAGLRRQWSSLPQAGAALSLIHDELQRRADAGDAPAACRLGAELVRCGTLRTLTSDLSLAEADADLQLAELEEGPDAARQSGAWTLRMIDQSRSCTGITDAQLLRANHYLRQGALAGIPEAAMRYAEGQGLAMVNVVDRGMFGFLRAPGLDAWRREAVPLVERQLRLGNPAATLTLMAAYGDDNTLFSGLVSKDPELAYRYLILFRTVAGGKSPDPGIQLPPEAAMRARAEARRMYQQYFGGRPGPKGAFQQINPMLGDGTGLAVAPCEPDDHDDHDGKS